MFENSAARMAKDPNSLFEAETDAVIGRLIREPAKSSNRLPSSTRKPATWLVSLRASPAH